MQQVPIQPSTITVRTDVHMHSHWHTQTLTLTRTHTHTQTHLTSHPADKCLGSPDIPLWTCCSTEIMTTRSPERGAESVSIKIRLLISEDKESGCQNHLINSAFNQLYFSILPREYTCPLASLLDQRQASPLEVTTFTHSTGHRVGISRPQTHDCIIEDDGWAQRVFLRKVWDNTNSHYSSFGRWLH